MITENTKLLTCKKPFDKLGGTFIKGNSYKCYLYDSSENKLRFCVETNQTHNNYSLAVVFSINELNNFFESIAYSREKKLSKV